VIVKVSLHEIPSRGSISDSWYLFHQGNGERRHSVPHTHSEWTTIADGYVQVPWVPDYRRWWVYDGIPYQVKQRAGDRGITAENTDMKTKTCRKLEEIYKFYSPIWSRRRCANLTDAIGRLFPRCIVPVVDSRCYWPGIYILTDVLLGCVASRPVIGWRLCPSNSTQMGVASAVGTCDSCCVSDACRR